MIAYPANIFSVNPLPAYPRHTNYLLGPSRRDLRTWSLLYFRFATNILLRDGFADEAFALPRVPCIGRPCARGDDSVLYNQELVACAVLRQLPNFPGLQPV